MKYRIEYAAGHNCLADDHQDLISRLKTTDPGAIEESFPDDEEP